LTGIGRILEFLIARYNIAGAAAAREKKSRAVCTARRTGLKDET
jgi:hypothetical protein